MYTDSRGRATVHAIPAILRGGYPVKKRTKSGIAALLLIAILCSIVPAYAAPYTITLNAGDLAHLPYWEFKTAGTESGTVTNLTSGKSSPLPEGDVARVSLAIGRGSEEQVSCGISINGAYYVQSVTLEHPDFFTGTVEIQVGQDAKWTEEVWGKITPLAESDIIARVEFRNGAFTENVTITATPMTAKQAEAAEKANLRQVVAKGKYTLADISDAIEGILSWKREQAGLGESEPLLSGELLQYAGTSGADWLPIGLARYGVEDDYDAYLNALREYVEQKYREPDKLDRSKATEWHRIALAVLACGGDPTHFGRDENGNDINLIADGVYNRGQTMDLGAQGLNGWLWGLITLDSMMYNIPAGSSYTRMELVRTILGYQLSDGGFNLRVRQGSTADPDITAMAIQSMGPYYRTSNFNVKDPVDTALACLSDLQLDTGDFKSWGTRNSESTSQVIISLCSVGIDPQNDRRFIKNGINLLDALFYYRQEDGGFAHSYDLDESNAAADPGESNSMATDQALLALVAVWRQAQGLSPLYDFRPNGVSAKIWTEEETEVSFAGSYEFTEELQARTDALPKSLSTQDREEVDFLLERLKMSRDFGEYDAYMEKLTAAQSSLDALDAEIEGLNADIVAQILPMTDAGLGEKSTVDTIVKRYKALSDHDKTLIDNWDAVLTVKSQTDAAQRTLLLAIGGAVVVMVAVTVIVRRRRENA